MRRPSAIAAERPYAHILKRCKQSEATWFHKVVTNWMIRKDGNSTYYYQLEFPYPFVLTHGEHLRHRVTFERLKSDRKWEMRVAVKDFPSQRKSRVYVYGTGGWKTFAMDNGIQLGDLLIFSLIEPSRFLVRVYRNKPTVATAVPTVKDADDDAEDDGNDKVLQPALKERSTDHTLNQNSCKACGRATTRPQFVTTVSLPHMDVDPGFWVRHRRMLRSNFILLKGPNKKVMQVEVRKYYGPMQTTYQLEFGWTEFAVANMLNVGDALVFSMVGPYRFKVVDRNVLVSQ